MKKWILFLVLVLVIQSICNVTSVLAQSDKDIADIKKVLIIVLSAFAYQDLDTAMNQFSANYYGEIENGIGVDYTTFKLRLKNHMYRFFKKYIIYSFSNLQIVEISFVNDEATARIEYDWKAYDIETSQWVERKEIRLLSFAKKDGTWKITYCKRS